VAGNIRTFKFPTGNWAILRTPAVPLCCLGWKSSARLVEVALGVGQIHQGDRVWTMMQGLGGVRADEMADTRNMSWFRLGRRSSATRFRSIAFAASGLAGVTAYQGCFTLGLLAGKRPGVTGRWWRRIIAVLLAREARQRGGSPS